MAFMFDVTSCRVCCTAGPVSMLDESVLPSGPNSCSPKRGHRVLTTEIPVVTIRTATYNVQNLHYVHTVHLCVLCGSESKQRLFPYTALTDWFL
jgi:hypothetical protein